MKPDPLNYGKTNAAYWDEQYPGVFAPLKLQGATKHANLASPTPRKVRKIVAPLPLRAPERQGDSIIITMPLPGRELSPNGRVHWNVKREAVKAARNAAAMLVRVVASEEWWGRAVRIDATFYGGRRLDSDNAWSSLKSHRDGIADGLMTTDAQFELGEIKQITGKASGGRREVELTITNLGTT